MPYLYADFYGTIKKGSLTARLELTKVTSTPCRLAIIGSLFIPFLAARLLYLNHRVRWASPCRASIGQPTCS